MRKLLVDISIEWQDYEDVADELILEDAITLQKEGVSYKIINP